LAASGRGTPARRAAGTGRPSRGSCGSGRRRCPSRQKCCAGRAGAVGIGGGHKSPTTSGRDHPRRKCRCRSLPRQAAGTLRLQPPRGAAGVLPIEERPAERALVSEGAVRIERPGSTSSIGFRVPLPVLGGARGGRDRRAPGAAGDRAPHGRAPGAPRCQNPARGGIHVAGWNGAGCP
jgi:hypothetical protein